MAGKAIESAASILAKDMKQPQSSASTYDRAAQIFHANNNIDRAIDMYEKAGK
jgi:hypothetical protein